MGSAPHPLLERVLLGPLRDAARPDLSPALRALGRIAGDEGNLKEAEEYLARAVAECRDLAEARGVRFDRAVMSYSAIAPVRHHAHLPQHTPLRCT